MVPESLAGGVVNALSSAGRAAPSSCLAATLSAVENCKRSVQEKACMRAGGLIPFEKENNSFKRGWMCIGSPDDLCAKVSQAGGEGGEGAGTDTTRSMLCIMKGGSVGSSQP